jgi:hypothetical protein
LFTKDFLLFFTHSIIAKNLGRGPQTDLFSFKEQNSIHWRGEQKPLIIRDV